MRLPACSLLILGILFSTCLSPCRARSEPSPVSQALDYDIAEQPLDLALASFARASHVDIIYKASLAGQRTSPSVSGRYPPSQALNRLLEGSGLAWSYTRADAVVIYDPANAIPSDTNSTVHDEPTLILDTLEVRSTLMVGNRQGQFTEYAHMAMSRLTRLLAPKAELQEQAYRGTLRLWVQEDGVITRAALSGENDSATVRDIEASVIGMRLAKPPAGLPQPIRFTVEARR